MIRKHIFLTGFMGSGKSTVGPRIAQALGYAFTDLDDEIERREKRTIDDIFRLSGETHFRALERTYLQDFIDSSETVFALGGGTVTIEGVIEFLKTHGILIYLKTDVDELVARLHGHSHRPLLRGTEESDRSEEGLQRRIVSLLRQREAYYRQADIVTDTTRKAVDSVVEELLNSLADAFHNDDLRIIR
jgi:shikimate kinase